MTERKNAATGNKLLLAVIILTVVNIFAYAAFGIKSQTTVPAILACLAIALVLSLIILLKDSFFSDYLMIGISFLLGLAFATLCGNSIGDVTEFITGVGMYGDPGNVYFRAVLAVMMLANAVVTFIASRK